MPIRTEIRRTDLRKNDTEIPRGTPHRNKYSVESKVDSEIARRESEKARLAADERRKAHRLENGCKTAQDYHPSSPPKGSTPYRGPIH
jgi:hypothetical protein